MPASQRPASTRAHGDPPRRCAPAAPRVWAGVAAIALACGQAWSQSGPPIAGWETPAAEPASAAPAAASGPHAPAAGATLPDESAMPLGGARGGADRDDPRGAGTDAGAKGWGWTRTAVSVGVVVGVVLVLAGVVQAAARRSGSLAAMLGPGGRAPSGVLEVLGRYPVGRGATLVLLRVDRRVLLLSQTFGRRGGGFETLAEFQDPEEVAGLLRASRDEAGESLASRFRQAMERLGEQDVAPRARMGSGDGVDRGEVIEVGPGGRRAGGRRGVWA